MLEVGNIPRNDTSLVGIFQQRRLSAEAVRAKLLRGAVKIGGNGASWNGFETIIRELSKAEEQQAVNGILRSYQSRYPESSPNDFIAYVESISPEIESRHARQNPGAESAIL